MNTTDLAGLLIMAALAACGASPADAAPITSGRYEQLNLAVAPNGDFTGVYTDEQGQGVVKKCTFAVAGRIAANGQGNVTAWSAGDPAKRGRIAARGETVTLSIPGAQDFPGCGMVIPPQIEDGLSYSKTASTRWTSMRAIVAPRAPLHVAAAGAATRGYVVRGDVVGVRAQQGSRLGVDYVTTTGRVVSGWVAASQTAPLAPR